MCRASTVKAHAGASPSWETMWSAGLKPGQAFDVGGASATLLGLLSRGVKPGARALVPGCGRAYDALALAAHGFSEVVALDLSPTAVKAAESLVAASDDQTAASKVKCVAGDFFEPSTLAAGQFDFVWDCTFLCALDPSVREQWAARHKALLAPGGVLASCVFPICNKQGGPPYALTCDLVQSLLVPHGLACEAVEVDEAEFHRPGGAREGPVAAARTALLLARA